MLTEERLAALLVYCRIDAVAAAERTLVETLYAAAVGYLEQAGVSEPAAGTSRRGLYDLCVNHLVLDGYDRRDITITGTIVSENPAFRQKLNQLKWTEPVPNLDTGSGEGV